MMAAIKVHGALNPLEHKDEDILESESAENSQHGGIREHVSDMHTGNYWMSDDFDDELPDSFWFGEDD